MPEGGKSGLILYYVLGSLAYSIDMSMPLLLILEQVSMISEVAPGEPCRYPGILAVNGRSN